MKDFFKSTSKYFMQIRDTGRDIIIFTYSTLLLILIFCLDILNKPSELIISIPLHMRCILLIGSAVLLSIYAVNKRLIQNYKIVLVNYIDSLSIISFTTCFFSALVWSITENFSYKTIGALILCAVSAISIIIRLFFFKKVNKNSSKDSLNKNSSCDSSSNVIYDLKSIYEDNFSVEHGKPILISEKDVDYDLLGRKSIIDQLYMYISSYKADTSYVIGLIGEWGSGKTTIINNVKKKFDANQSIVFIDDFDPWVFGTQEALLCEMFDKIMKKTGIELSILQSKTIIKNLNNIMTDAASDIKIAKSFIDKLISSEKGDVSYLTKEIRNYLTLNNKTVVFFIDNIDRAEADNIIFMFKLIGTVFNLPNIVYVLSYDKERVNEILKDTKKINPKYIEKIIQQEIYVPKMQCNRLKDIYQTCICNVLKRYDVTEAEIKVYSPIIDYICDTVDNLRSFKRLINSVFSNVFLNTCKLDKVVLLAIEIIHFLDFSLYESIFENAKYYISSEYFYSDELRETHHNEEKFNDNAKAYFDKEFKAHSKGKNILCKIFPYVYQYVNNHRISDVVNYEQINFIKQNVPIYSLKFFELYFSYSSNEFLDVTNEVDELIDLLNKSDNMEDIQNAFGDVLFYARNDTQKERLEAFQLHLDEIPINKLLVVIMLIWNHIYDIDDTPQFLKLSARSRATIIISMSLIKAGLDDIDNFIEIIKNDFSNLKCINDITYWMQSSKFNTPQSVKKLFEDLNSNMCERIINDRIDLFSDEYYRQYNISIGLFSFYKESEDRDNILKNYILSIYKDRYVYRAIADILTMGTGSHGFSYSLSENSFELLYIDENTIKESIKNNPPNNHSEEIIKDIFEKYQIKEMNGYEKYGISSPTPIIFEL